MGAGDDVLVTFAPQTANERRTHKAAMAGNVNTAYLVHLACFVCLVALVWRERMSEAFWIYENGRNVNGLVFKPLRRKERKGAPRGRFCPAGDEPAGQASLLTEALYLRIVNDWFTTWRVSRHLGIHRGFSLEVPAEEALSVLPWNLCS